MISEHTNATCFPKRIKSPYVLQYLQFEDRMKDPQKLKLLAIRSRQHTSHCKTQQNE